MTERTEENQLAIARRDWGLFAWCSSVVLAAIVAIWTDWFWLEVAVTAMLSFVLLCVLAMGVMTWRDYRRLRAERQQRVYSLSHE